MRKIAPLLILALSSLACVAGLTEGDRFYLTGDLIQAEAAYRQFLTSGRAQGNAEARARYRLGLIYALPQSDLYDIERAERALQTLMDLEPESSWGRQAALLLDLWRERERLSDDLELQKRRVDFLVGEIARAQEAASKAGDQVEDREANVDRLTREIGSLRQSIAELQAEVDERERELEQIKRVDLQPPP